MPLILQKSPQCLLMCATKWKMEVVWVITGKTILYAAKTCSISKLTLWCIKFVLFAFINLHFKCKTFANVKMNEATLCSLPDTFLSLPPQYWNDRHVPQTWLFTWSLGNHTQVGPRACFTGRAISQASEHFLESYLFQAFCFPVSNRLSSLDSLEN